MNREIEELKQRWLDGCVSTAEVLTAILNLDDLPVNIVMEAHKFAQQMRDLETMEAERLHNELLQDIRKQMNKIN